MDLKELLVESLPQEIKQHKDLLAPCADKKMGDYTIPCFALAKEQHKSPIAIAEQLAQGLQTNQMIASAQAVNGYLNLFFEQKICCATGRLAV